MPRKVNYGVDYEEDFYDYEDYNYDYDDGHEYAETNGECPSSPSQCFIFKDVLCSENVKSYIKITTS